MSKLNIPELKSCPFCGKIPELIDDRNQFYINCNNYKCVTMISETISEEKISKNPKSEFKTYKRKLILKWNKRIKGEWLNWEMILKAK